MNRKQAACFTVAAFLLRSTIATSAKAEPLSWDDSVRLATAHNPSLVAAHAQIVAANAGTRIARASLLPQLSLSAGADHSDRDTATSHDEVSYDTSLSVEQSLYSGGKNQSAVRAAEAARDGVLAQASATAATVTYDLRAAFIELLHAQEQAALLREIESRRQNNQELVELRYEGGREHKGSLALSEATLYDAQTQVRQAQRLVQAVGGTLLRTIGLTPDGGSIAVTGDLDSITLPEITTGDAAAMHTPAYERALALQAAAAAQVSSARGGTRPKVSVVGSVGRTGNEEAFEDDQWSVGLRLSLPFWSGGQDTHARVQAEANLREADAVLEETLNVQGKTLAELQVSAQNAVESAAVQERYVEAAALRAEISRQQYEDGLLTFENWDLIENDLITKRKGLLTSQRSAQLGAAAWRKQLGYTAFTHVDTR